MTILRSPRYTGQKTRLRLVVIAAVILLSVGAYVATQLGSDPNKVDCTICGGDGMVDRPDDCRNCNGTGRLSS